MTAALALLIAATGRVSAQALDTCESRAARPSAGFAITHGGADVALKHPVLVPAVNERISVDNGFGVSATGEIPVSARFGVRIELAHTTLPVHLRTFATADRQGSGTSTRIGDVGSSQFTAGIVRHMLTGRKICGYAAAAVGIYRFASAGESAASIGISGTAGLELPVPRKDAAVFGELQLNGVANGSRAPLAAQAVFLVKAAAGIRLHF